MKASRSGSDFIVCELCGLMLYWDWEKSLWVHEATGQVPCADPEHKEHYEPPR